jgi:hypothetical protein
MTRKRMIGLMMGIVLAAVVVLGVVLPAIAHEGREVADGEYTIVFGWRVEPAYTNLFNGPEFFVEGHDSGAGVTGLEDTLTLEVSYGGQSRIIRFRPVPETPGDYIADLIPTQPGDYSFRLTGTINDAAIDETFSSANGEFSTVEPIEDIQFP